MTLIGFHLSLVRVSFQLGTRPLNADESQMRGQSSGLSQETPAFRRGEEWRSVRSTDTLAAMDRVAARKAAWDGFLPEVARANGLSVLCRANDLTTCRRSRVNREVPRG